MNRLEIKVDDRTKRLRFGEMLTTGSRYAVEVTGGAETCGADAALFLSLPCGRQVAVAELSAGAGTLDLCCDAVMRLEETVPFGTPILLNAVLRCFDEGEEQNVAVGQCHAVAAWEGRADSATGTVVRWKGEKGEKGEKGDKGDKGDPGEKGELGEAPDMAEFENMVAVVESALSAETVARLRGDHPLDGYMLNTNTANAMRQAVKAIGTALGATMRVVAVCAALPLLGASVQTAPFGELDLDENPHVVTNVDFSGLARSEDIPPGMTTNDVRAIVAESAPPADLTPSTNYTDSVVNGLIDQLTDGTHPSGVIQVYEAKYALQANTAMTITGGDVEVSGTELLEAIGDEHAANVNQDTYLRDLSASISAVSNEAQVVYRLFSGSNVICEVTNYNSRVNPPTLSLLQLSSSNTYFTVWTETNGLARTFTAATNDAAQRVKAATAALPATYAPRAWSRTTSGLGEDAPTNTTWISTPTTVIAGGLEYAKVVHSGGEIWVLSGNGMVNFDPTTNSYLRISADDGTEIFSIEKTDAVTVGANADGITVSGDLIEIPVNVVSAEPPTAYWCTDLSSGTWSSGYPPGSTYATWYGTSGAWVYGVEYYGQDPLPSLMFFKFEYLKEGGTLIKNGAPMDVSGGIMCTDGIHKVRPVYSNGTVTWEVVQ